MARNKSRSEVLRVAQAQRLLLWAILSAIFLMVLMSGMQIIAVQAAQGKISIAPAQMMAAGLQKFAFLVVAIQIVSIVNLGLALRYGWWSAFFGVLQCVMCVSLIALLVLNSKATRLLQESAPLGFAPDWVDWQGEKGWQVTTDKGPQGSYDAIRVYLWLGMLNDEDPAKASLVAHFTPMLESTAALGAVPERVDTRSGQTQGRGPVGFAAALLPLSQGQPMLASLREQVKQHGEQADAYYGSVLTLFGAGWDQGRYRFAADGTLQPGWSESCQAD